MKQRKQKNKSIILRVLVLGVCVYMLVTLAGLWNTLNQSKAKLASLKEQYASEQNAIEELQAVLNDDSDSKIIEKAARERLGYVYSNEEVYIDISGN